VLLVGRLQSANHDADLITSDCFPKEETTARGSRASKRADLNPAACTTLITWGR